MRKEKIKQLLRVVRLTSEQRTKYISTKPLDGSNPEGSARASLKKHSSLWSREQKILIKIRALRADIYSNQ